MHRIQFRLGLWAPDPAEEAHSAPLDPLTESNGLRAMKCTTF